MNSYRYSKWVNPSPYSLDKDRVLDEFTRKFMSNSNLQDVLWDIQKNAFNTSPDRLPALEEMLEHLQHLKQMYLSRYNLDSVMDDIQAALDDIIRTERDGIEKKLQEIRSKSAPVSGDLSPEIRQKLVKSLEDKAEQNRRKLDGLPPDTGSRVKELMQYDFLSDDARRKFRKLMSLLKKRALDTYARELGNHLRNLGPAEISQVRRLAAALNRMLEQRMRGQTPDFEGFMRHFGRFFGQDAPRSLDDLIERLHDQITRAKALLSSLSPGQKKALENTLKSVLDEETQFELARLGINLGYLNQDIGWNDEFSFFGDQSISYSEALDLMETLRKINRLEEQIQEARFSHNLDIIDDNIVREELGEAYSARLQAMRQVADILEESGYLRRNRLAYELTPYAIRKIGEKALNTVFARLKRDRTGDHRTDSRGGGGERLFETKKYEFGDDFDLHIEKTILNALRRSLQKPVKLTPDDFEVFQEERLTRSATVLLLDLSLSMHMHGNFQAAKIVAIALDTLIRSRYPHDSLYIVGFSSYARQLSREDLNDVNWDNLDPYTNMQHGLSLSRKLLDRESGANKQILLITDGEPTAHFENSRYFFQYPPGVRTLRYTLKEVSLCTRSNVTINAFTLNSSGFSSTFMDQIARLNHGRVFSTTASNLGEYVIVDYLSSKKKLCIS